MKLEEIDPMMARATKALRLREQIRYTDSHLAALPQEEMKLTVHYAKIGYSTAGQVIINDDMPLKFVVLELLTQQKKSLEDQLAAL